MQPVRLPNEPPLHFYQQLCRIRKPEILPLVHSIFMDWFLLHDHLNYQHLESLHLQGQPRVDELPYYV